MGKKAWLGLALAGMMALSAACGGNSGGNTGNAGTSEGNGGGAAGGEDQKKFKIAISQVLEHPSLDETRKGFLKALEDAGITVDLDYNNAQNDPNNFKPIAEKIASGDADLVLGIATPNTQVLVDEVTDKPVLFAAVTDPVNAGIVPQMKAPGGNVTGAADTNPEAVKQLMAFIAKEFPDFKKIGLVIDQSEDNAVVMSGIAEEALKEHGMELVKAPIANVSDIQQAAQSLVGKVDAIYITLDNNVVAGADAIIDVANDNDIPFFSSDRDTVEKGAFATVGFKYFDHGYEAGQMAVEILLNGKNPGELDVTVPQKLDFILNLKAAEEQGITVTDAMKAHVKDPENNIIE